MSDPREAPNAAPGEFRLVRSDRPDEPIHLERDRPVKVGSGADCQIRVAGAPPVVAEVVVGEGPPRSRLWLPDLQGEPQVMITPYWTDGAGRSHPDEEATARPEPRSNTVRLEPGSTLEAGDTTLTLVKAGEAALSDNVVVAWLQRVVRVLFPGTSGGRGSRLDPDRALRPGDRRRSLIRYLGVVVDEREARHARHILQRGRIAAGVAIPVVIALTAVGWALAESGAVRATTVSVALVALGILATLVTSSFFFSGVGAPVLAITLASATIVGAFDPTLIYFLPLLIPGFWYLGGVLDLAWFPVPSLDRYFDAGLMLAMTAFWLAYPVFAWDTIPLQSAPGLLLLACAVVVLAWTFLVVPRLHRSVVAGTTRPLRRDGILPPAPKSASPDALYLAEYTWLHRRRRLATRTLAVVLAAVPVLIVLNSVDLSGRVGLPAELRGDSAILVWPGAGRVVDSSALDSLPMMALADSAWEEIGFERLGFDFYAVRQASAVPALADHTLESVSDLRDALARGDPIWTPASGDIDGQRVADLKRIRVLETTPAILREGDRVSLLTAPIALMLVFFGVLILWRAHAQGAVAFLAALWALGAGAMLALLPNVDSSFLLLPELWPLQELLLSSMSLSGPLALVHGLLIVLTGATVLLAVGVLSGVIPGLLVAEWLLARHPSEPAEFAKRITYRGGALAAIGGVWFLTDLLTPTLPDEAGSARFVFEVLVPVALLVGLMLGIHRVGETWFGEPRAKTGPPPAELRHLGFLALPWLFLLIPYALSLGGGLNVWPVLAMIVLWLLCAVAIFWFVAWENTWNLGGGRAGTTLAMAVVLPVGFALVESVTEDLLVDWQVVPRAATSFATLILFGLLLRPVFRRLSALAEILLLWPVRRIVPRIPELMARLLRSSNETEKRTAIKEVLEGEDIALANYMLFTRKGTPGDLFRPLVQGGGPASYDAPDLEPSEELLGDLAARPGFIDLKTALEEPRFASTAPELWRVSRRLRTTCPSPWRYLLPLTVGSTVLGLLFVAEDALDKGRRREGFAQWLSDLGVASM